MREENVLVVLSLLIISLSAMLFAGYAMAHQGSSEVLVAVVMIPSSVVSGLIGYLTKGLVDRKSNGGNNEETP